MSNQSNRSEGFFSTADGSELYFQIWNALAPKGYVLITHGMCEHSDRYHNLALQLNQIQYTAIGWDLRGHGRSSGQRGYVRSFHELVQDHKVFTDYVKTHYMSSPDL